MIRAQEVMGYSCTKLADLLETKPVKWWVDNLEGAAAYALQRRIAQCSREIAVKNRPIINMILHAIRERDTNYR